MLGWKYKHVVKSLSDGNLIIMGDVPCGALNLFQ